MEISFTTRGELKKTQSFLDRMITGDYFSQVEALAKKGVAALASATPVDSGLTAAAWGYDIRRSGRSLTITWTNTNLENGFPVAVMLQYGHGTGTGGYVRGQDYINPAIKPVMDGIADGVWKLVTKS